MNCCSFLRTLVLIFSLGWVHSASAQNTAPALGDIPASPSLHWELSAAINRYEEPGTMQEIGPELGLHLRINHVAQAPQWQFESDAMLGKQRYSSEESGTQNGVTNIESRWRALTSVGSGDNVQQGLSTGVALHTLWNDLRGTTSKGYGGYERIAAQLWLPVRWASAEGWTLDGGLLLYGRHTSRLSEVSRLYEDIVNTQHRGLYGQWRTTVKLDSGETLIPFVRYTYLDNSNVVRAKDPRNKTTGYGYWVEPESYRWQIGMSLEFNAP